MRTIEVDIDVFAAIWRNRKHGEVNENQILRRILLADSATPSHIENESEPLTPSNENLAHKNTTKEHSFGKIRWVDDVVMALKELGGRASLNEIYKKVKHNRLKSGRSTPRTLEATVRRTLEDYSSDSKNFKNRGDIFHLVDRGIWELRN